MITRIELYILIALLALGFELGIILHWFTH